MKKITVQLIPVSDGQPAGQLEFDPSGVLIYQKLPGEQAFSIRVVSEYLELSVVNEPPYKTYAAARW